MPETTLNELLERNSKHVQSLRDGYFRGVEASQEPAAVSICCSDSRVSQSGMWAVDEAGWLFSPSNIGNQVWEQRDGELIVSGSILYPIVFSETRVTVVVGHTGCGAVSAALAAVRDGMPQAPLGIQEAIRLLVPVVEEGLADERVDPEADVGLVNQLVEYNVDRQVEFLLESGELPDEEVVYGFVYDFHGIYGEEPGRAYLVNADGETDVRVLAEGVYERFSGQVRRLL